MISPYDNPSVVRCRVNGLGWFFWALWFGVGVLVCAVPALDRSMHPSTPADIWFFETFGALIDLSSLLFLVYLLRAVVVVTETGLRWRGMRGWKQADWEFITDFYVKRGQKSSQLLVLETSGDKLMFSTDLWTHAAAFRESVAERAVHAANREWAEKGDRAVEKWPLVFSYDTPDNRSIRSGTIPVGILVFLMFGLMLTQLLPKVPQTIALMGWGWGLSMAGMALLMPLLVVAMFVPLLKILWNSVKSRQEQRITVSEESITFSDNQRMVRALWSEMVECYSETPTLTSAPRHVVVTRQGTFDYTSAIADFRVLQNLIRRLAPEAVERGLLSHSDSEDLMPSRQNARPDENLYHYRNRTVRVLLLVPTLFTLLLPASELLRSYGLLPPAAQDNRPMILGCTLLLGSLTALAWWRYYAARVRTDSYGITQDTLIGRKTLAWGDIEDYYKAGGDMGTFYVIQGSRQRLSIWFGITRLPLLKEEIVRRAVHSRSKSWQAKTTS